MSSKRRGKQRARNVSTGRRAGTGEELYGPIPAKLTPKEQQEHADYWEILRLLKGKRRPEHVPLFRKYYAVNLNRNEADLEKRHHKNTTPVDQVALHLDALRDMAVRSMILGSDTVMYFAGEKFCDLLEAIDAPPVTDLSVLRRIGNHTAMVLYSRNVSTGNEGDSLVAMSVTINHMHLDGIPRILGSVIHEDNSISTFMYQYEEHDEDLATVAWSTGAQERIGDLSTEEKLISNTLALLAQQSVFTVEEWKHYPRAVVTAAAKDKRKLPPVNVLGLTKYVQKDLDEHHAATRIERDFCWPVRGHYRMQAHGPERKMRKLKLIRPHVKGNLDGPLIARAQVHAAK